MKMWILIFASALFVGGTCLGVALQPRIAPAVVPAEKRSNPAPAPAWGQHHNREFSVHRFASELDLSGEQDRELDLILSDGQEETQALGRAMRASQDKTRERIMELLTPDQKSKLDSLMAAERQKRSDGEISRSVGVYTKILGLDEKQASALKTAMVDARARRREMKRGDDWMQVRKSVREEQNKSLEKAFTPEQFKRYLEISELDRGDR